ncbi:MAG: HD domain-containing protein [Candidatus Midichloria mitochondrii]|uniref:HD domain-containing protein n=1 Tax=Candidatus Midichloria mitochondrii TaxID=234827 RepID=UPI000307E9EB|nr:HD domain-containing protein [Candidatus Midichloria mitochondrii]MDJ1256651.1 HD domain-containing protein [Candidatus Midichloria mitochondrii]MDJ1288521.1 HD domain-containing protein [Candidatus Midichloria mitochondrii]MDJ1299124.1 HD domain-containing protein [Candidatus Midichloria mitochondrii]MDJ1313340.1 HD domain-containing protein [Candidatus Midichloria mitochondrii]MDJ1583932.1 HD domain-containing protein [Candidatus Midichloria mitochondrii]
MEAKSDDIEKLAIDCRYSKRLIDKLLSKNSKSQIKVDCDKISKALYIACKYHNNQRRATGELYFSHSIEVAYIVADYLFKTDIIIAAILHDCIEDTELMKETIAKEFNNKITDYVAD